jgi:hypothetical protein
MYIVLAIAICLALLILVIVVKGLRRMAAAGHEGAEEDLDRKIGVAPADQWKLGRVQEPND